MTAPTREDQGSISGPGLLPHHDQPLVGPQGSEPRQGVGRVPYREVGAAMRQAISRVLLADLGPRQLSTFLAVLSLTGTYSKLSDSLYLAHIAEMVFGTGEPTVKQVKRIGEDLKALAATGAIERDPPRRGRPTGGGARYRVALPPEEMAPPTGPIPPHNGPTDRAC